MEFKSHHYLLLLLFSLASDQISGNFIYNLRKLREQENGTIQEKWKFYETFMNKSMNSAVNEVLPYALQTFSKSNVSSQCLREIMILIKGLQKLRTWAVRFVDSSGKTIDGLQCASISSFGSFDECVDTVAFNDTEEGDMKEMFRGQYCSIDFKPALPKRDRLVAINEFIPELRDVAEEGTVMGAMAKKASVFYLHPLRVGVCFPSGCSRRDINKVVSQIGESFTLEMWADQCDVKEQIKISEMKSVIICVYSFTGGLFLLGSLVDLYMHIADKSVKNRVIEVLVTFSLMRNFKKLTNTESRSGSLTCLDGIRVMTMTWIILAHSYGMVVFRMYDNLIDLEKHAKSFTFQVVANASLSVDTFFCMGGLLLSYLGTRLVKEENHQFNITIVLLRRLWRLYPMYAYLIFFTILTPMFGSGPLWRIEEMNEWCKDKWWTNMLFINNLYKANEMCLPHSWYLSCDFQLFLVGLLVMFILKKWRRAGLFLCGVIIVACIIHSTVITYVFDLPPTTMFTKLDLSHNMKFWQKQYFQPFIHAPPYFIGFLTGYLLATKPSMNIPLLLQFMGWTLAFIMNFSVVYGTHPWNSGIEPTFWETILYAAFSRSAWALGVCWVIICCSTGIGGPVNYFLSAKFFIPLSRITFVTYLIHPIIIWLFTRSIRIQMHLDFMMFIWIFIGHVCVSFGTAFAGSMFLETPMMSLEKIVFKNYKKKFEDSIKYQTNGHSLEKVSFQNNREKRKELANIRDDPVFACKL